jgi:hypothetical protein
MDMPTGVREISIQVCEDTRIVIQLLDDITVIYTC